jgi:hypothetical protein|tara:strand:+ start:9212 stop:9586 length:375 start_codon:yes stop_codon:yes gene_type:complete
MSTLKVATLQDTSGNNSSTPEQVAQGRAKAWAKFDGTGTVAITDDFNISSLADNGTGKYTLSFTNAMANTNYCVVTAASSGAQSNVDTWFNPIVFNTGSVQVAGQNSSSANVDRTLNNVVVFGD